MPFQSTYRAPAGRAHKSSARLTRSAEHLQHACRTSDRNEAGTEHPQSACGTCA